MFSFVSANSETMITIENDSEKITIGRYIELIEDKKGILTIKDVSAITEGWKFLDSDIVHRGYSESVWWFRLTVENKSNDDLYIEFNRPFIHEIDFFEARGKKGYRTVHSGAKYPFYNRKIKDINFIFKITKSKVPATVYFRVKSYTLISYKIDIWTHQAFLSRLYEKIAPFWAYFGLLSVMFLLDLFIFISNRDKNYLYLGILILSWLCYQTSAYGFGFMYIWQDSPEINFTVMQITITLIIISVGLFIRSFLKTKSEFPVFHKAIKFYIAAAIIMIPVIIYNPKGILKPLLTLGSIALTINISFSIVALLKGSRPARFLVAAFSINFISNILSILIGMGFISFALTGVEFTRFGSLSIVIFLTLGVIDNLNTMKKNLQKNEVIIKNKNLELTKSNMDLAETNEELSATNEELEAMNCQMEDMFVTLQQSEKNSGLSLKMPVMQFLFTILMEKF